MSVLDCAAKTHVEDLGLLSTEKQVLLILCMHINKDITDGHKCNPSLALISKEVGVKPRQISKIVASLIKKKLIKIHAGKFSNTYFINVAMIVEAHNKWRESFKAQGEKLVSPFKEVSKDDVVKFEKVESKRKDWVRDTSGLKRGNGTPPKEPAHVWRLQNGDECTMLEALADERRVNEVNGCSDEPF